jgi:DNA-binding FrmR family transcriptional regulator
MEMSLDAGRWGLDSRGSTSTSLPVTDPCGRIDRSRRRQGKRRDRDSGPRQLWLVGRPWIVDIRHGMLGDQRPATAVEYPPGVWYAATAEVTVSIDQQTRRQAIRRLSIIEGQIRGLRNMVEDDAYCVDVLTQISAIHEALRGVGKVVVRHHLETCVTEGLQGDDGERRQHYDELMKLIYTLSK